VAKTVNEHFADAFKRFADLPADDRKQLVKWAKAQPDHMQDCGIGPLGMSPRMIIGREALISKKKKQKA